MGRGRVKTQYAGKNKQPYCASDRIAEVFVTDVKGTTTINCALIGSDCLFTRPRAKLRNQPTPPLVTAGVSSPRLFDAALAGDLPNRSGAAARHGHGLGRVLALAPNLPVTRLRSLDFAEGRGRRTLRLHSAYT